MAAGIAGLLIAGTATAGIASASSAATAPAAGKHWHVIFRAPRVSPGLQGTQDFTAVVATGRTTGFAFDGIGAPAGETAWQRTGRAGAGWTRVPFPGKTNEEVAYAAASSPPNVLATANRDPVQRSARDPVKPSVPNAHTFAGDEAAA